MSSGVRGYLEAHPTPWRVERVNFDKWADRVEQIVDMNGAVVVGCEDAESFQAVFTPEGGVEALVNFVNLVGEEYEPPCGWPSVDNGPFNPLTYQYGVQYTSPRTGEPEVEWVEETGNKELDQRILDVMLGRWRKAMRSRGLAEPQVVRRLTGEPELALSYPPLRAVPNETETEE